ncbi:hypothetical protein SELR_pSRC300570 (plasmid) [Selenomonas ruminantium subsp. lactilytica TAM6421]|uniref:Uncharacterized protein n=1 Tax=Selenomonas ruminantium subsp. lactilytica (strain NBRC 103574 / TAM6421) TaxID=927704 RepID=I0GWJ3_SELRL|nr:hypothetical protein [Selenomonas ruminantium]BAL85130.1 hypothetical protein SELR_pSRC300570 [Selenomonas ruminantium subsp. lactilytica TAM6421]
MVIIDKKHEQKINEILKGGQGKSTARTIDNAEELISLVEKYKSNLPPIPKAHLNHCKLIIFVGAGHFANAYKYIPMGTQVTIEFGRDGLGRLVSVSRTNVKGAKEYSFMLTKEAKQSALRCLNILPCDYDKDKDCWKAC